MRIACPACNAAYEVPDEQLRGGRMVRCARCGTNWTPVVAVTEEAGEREGRAPAPPDVPATVEPEAAPPPRKMALDAETPPVSPIPVAAPVADAPRPSLLLPAAWVVSVLVVLGGLAAVVVQRGQVMAAWPPSIRGYAAVGLADKP